MVWKNGEVLKNCVCNFIISFNSGVPSPYIYATEVKAYKGNQKPASVRSSNPIEGEEATFVDLFKIFFC